MPWEPEAEKDDTTRSTRVDGKIVRAYVGSGVMAIRVAEGFEFWKAARRGAHCRGQAD